MLLVCNLNPSCHLGMNFENLWEVGIRQGIFHSQRKLVIKPVSPQFSKTLVFLFKHPLAI
ncbi:hypothetical protein ADN00_08865 [Ornatilinea apprima]|uniref:Uncharacterized protein n=1 Tax=Ornatilinea apprima TaxID=1134406 RepID=A0A0P6X346_9CHLR|nr:hypothetical protein ADN00_08865 [Ornatilinea apprima]